MMANVYDIDHKELVALTVDELRAYGAAKWISGNNDGCEDDGTEDEVELRVVVRCRDCVHFDSGSPIPICNLLEFGVPDQEERGFCAWGELDTGRLR